MSQYQLVKFQLDSDDAAKTEILRIVRPEKPSKQYDFLEKVLDN